MDAELAFKALFGKRALKWSEAQIAEALDALSDGTGWVSVFVCEAMRLAPKDKTLESWAEVLGVLQQLRTLDVTLSTKKAWLLGALQAATVSESPTIPVTVALAREGSDASRDALIADFERVRRSEVAAHSLKSFVRELKRYGKGVAFCDVLRERAETELSRLEKET